MAPAPLLGGIMTCFPLDQLTGRPCFPMSPSIRVVNTPYLGNGRGAQRARTHRRVKVDLGRVFMVALMVFQNC